MPAPSVGYQGCSTVESVRPQMTPQNFLTMSEGWRKLGRTEPNSSLEAAGEQPIMPAMAQGPLEEPPGPVSPAWWPARKAATVSSCEKRHNQLRSPPMRGHQLTVQINLLPSPHLFLPPPPRGTATLWRNDVSKRQGAADSGATHPSRVVQGCGIGMLYVRWNTPICCSSAINPPPPARRKEEGHDP